MTAAIAESFREAVTLDVNAYVYLSKLGTPDGLAELMRSETQGGILPLLNPIVLLEQLAAAGSQTKISGTPLLDSLRTMRTHCAVGHEGRIAMFVDPEAGHCRALFGRVPDGATENLETFKRLLTGIVDSPDADQFRASHEDLFCFLTDHVRELEADFERSIFEGIVRPVFPDVTSWEDLRPQKADKLSELEDALSKPEIATGFAGWYVDKAARSLGIRLTTEQRDERAKWLSGYLSVPMALFKTILRRVLGQGARLNKSRERNSFWDLHILMGIGDYHTVNGLPLKLVSSDRAMATAASKAGYASYVMDFDQYLSNRDLPPRVNGP